jgi:hypothetical protein
MGGLFGGDSGPSAGDIQRAEEAAFKKETERLRIQEQKLRRRESEETMQGVGVATPGNIELGTDKEDLTTGAERVTGNPITDAAAAAGLEPTEDEQMKELTKKLSGGLGGRINLGFTL